MSLLSLNEIGLKYGTDKASNSHDYLEFYERFFAPLRHSEITLLEIGVAQGASLKTWEAYFPNARIIGADILLSSKRFERARVAIELIDQSDLEDLVRIAVKHGPFDIVIEDGSHMWEHQITSLRTLFPFVKHNGFYVVEDLHTNYGTWPTDYKGVATTRCSEFLKSWADLCVAHTQKPLAEVEDAFLRTYGRSAQCIAFFSQACLIQKRVLTNPRTVANVGVRLIDVGERACEVLNILAHVSERGDVYAPTGFINLDSERFPIQGLTIHCEETLLEYRVRGQDGVWGAWCSGGKFAGSRGSSKLLTGVSVRILDTSLKRHTLRVTGRFVGSDALLTVGDGEDCTLPSLAVICGIQIDLFKNT